MSAVDEYDYSTSERAPTYEYEEKVTHIKVIEHLWKSLSGQFSLAVYLWHVVVFLLLGESQLEVSRHGSFRYIILMSKIGLGNEYDIRMMGFEY